MPQQSILVDRSQAVTTKRRQTLADLVQNTRHHSPTMRKDAVLGLLELITTYDGFLEAETTPCINSVLPLIGDDDLHVRGAVARYLKTVLEMLDAALFAPYASPMLLLTTSAMSHIRMPVRLDALKILELLLRKVGTAATDGWEQTVEAKGAGDRHGQRILQAFLAMLGVAADAQRIKAGHTATKAATSMELQPADRLRVLRTLHIFLSVAMQTQESSAALPAWCASSLLTAEGDREHFVQLFRADELRPTRWMAASVPGVSVPSVCEALVLGARGDAGGESVTTQAPERLAHILHTAMLATLLESLPSALSVDGSTSAMHLDTVLEVLEVCLLLWRPAASAAAAGERAEPTRGSAPLAQLLQHLSPHFPVQQTGPMSPALEHLHVVYCELVALATLAAPGKALNAHLASTVSYLVTLLDSDDNISPETYEALLPTFWLLLSTPVDGRAALLEALVRHAHARSTTALEGVVFRFLARIAQLPTYKSLRIDMADHLTPGVHAAWQEWLLGLPRTMWTLATRAVSSRTSSEDVAAATTLLQDMLQFLRWVYVQSDDLLFTTDTLAALAPRLKPLYTVQHPRRGPRLGPLRQLPRALPAAQALARTAPLEIEDLAIVE